MKRISLTRSKFAMVDDEDYDYLMQWKWQAMKGKYTWYVARGCPAIVRGKMGQKTLYMHRAIMHCSDTSQVDHISHNGLDNRKCNLRICTVAQNNYNLLPHKNSTSKYKGVYREANRWHAQIRHGNKRMYLGSYESEVDAAEAYDAKAKEEFGAFAYLNLTHT